MKNEISIEQARAEIVAIDDRTSVRQRNIAALFELYEDGSVPDRTRVIACDGICLLMDYDKKRRRDLTRMIERFEHPSRLRRFGHAILSRLPNTH